MYVIRFKFKKIGKAPVTLSGVQPGYSLLEVALQNGIDLRHDCGGICGCSTCLLYVEKGVRYVAPKNRREEDLMKKSNYVQMDSRLACQCLLQEGSGEIDLTVPDQPPI